MYLHEITDAKTIEIARKDPRVIIERMFHIVDKGGKRVPFKFNRPQTKFYEENFLNHINRDVLSSRDARIDILKARKQGFSSVILAIWTVKFLFIENAWCVCISHEDEATQRLFSKVEYFLNNLELNGEPVKVDLDTRSRKRLKYKYMNTEFYLGTAGSMNFGRGDTIHYLHASEIAFWKDASIVMTAAQTAVPDDFENTMIVKESTANGMGTQHHKEWMAEERGESAYKPVFFGWNEEPEYQMTPDKDFKMTDVEKIIAGTHGLSIEQIVWRRWKISSMQASDKYTKDELFMQEYPLSPGEAFLSSGKPIFSRETTEFYREAFVKKPQLVGELTGWSPPIFTTNPSERLLVWEEPSRESDYIISADVAEKKDSCYAMVIDRRTYRQVACWHGNTEEFELAGILYRLGMWYNEALIGVERNNHGVAVVKKLDELGYKRQYVRESVDEISQKQYNELGWRTDSKTRPIMISDLNQAVTQRQFIIRDETIVNQMETFVRNERGRAEAVSGAHDDAIIAAAIAVQLYKSIPESLLTSEVIVRNYRPNDSLYNFSRK